MSEEEAIERLKERVKLDRKIRDNKTESDYEQFCENECQAIETILNLADKQQKEIEEKNIAINKMSKDISTQLEDIEDKKVEVAVDFIEEKRDKYWKDKIREKIKTQIQKFFDIHDGEHSINEICFESTKVEGAVEILKELLEENDE